MADPIGNYLAGLGFMGGPEVNPGALTPEQLAAIKPTTFMPLPGLPFRGAIAAERTVPEQPGLQFLKELLLRRQYAGLP